MAEAGTNVQEATSQNQPAASNGIPQELKDQMELSLNGGMTLEKAEQQNQAAPNQNGSAQQPGNEANQPVVTPADPFGIFKEKFGYQTPEDAIKEIEELRTFKATPVTPEYEFENEESKKAFLALTKGDRKEALKIFEQQERIENFLALEVNKDNAADIIKLGIQLKNKDLTSAEVEFQYKQEYLPPKEPVQKATEDEDEFAERHNEWKETVERVEMKRVIAAKMAKPELELAKTKIVFPTIEESVDEGYLQYKKSLEDQPKIDAEMKEIYKPFTPESIETKVKFTDEPNKVDFEFQYKPGVDGFEKSREMALDSNKFFDYFKLPDGKFDNRKFLDAIHFATNKEKILTEAMNQAKNATIKSFLPDNSNGGTQRQFPQGQELSELDKQMQASLKGY